MRQAKAGRALRPADTMQRETKGASYTAVNRTSDAVRTLREHKKQLLVELNQIDKALSALGDATEKAPRSRKRKQDYGEKAESLVLRALNECGPAAAQGVVNYLKNRKGVDMPYNTASSCLSRLSSQDACVHDSSRPRSYWIAK